MTNGGSIDIIHNKFEENYVLTQLLIRSSKTTYSISVRKYYFQFE